MRQIKGYIYSLLLLMVLFINSGSVLLSAHCHCSADDPALKHHECHQVEECQEHRSVVSHRCHADSEPRFEYLVVAPQRLDSTCSTLFVCVIRTLLLADSIDASEEHWILESEDLYKCYVPSFAAPRAPPLLG